MLNIDTVKEIIEMNKKDQKPDALFGEVETETKPKFDLRTWLDRRPKPV